MKRNTWAMAEKDDRMIAGQFLAINLAAEPEVSQGEASVKYSAVETAPLLIRTIAFNRIIFNRMNSYPVCVPPPPIA